MTEVEKKTPPPDPIIRDADLYQAFQLMHRKDYKAAENRIHDGLKKAKAAGDTNLEGLYLSAKGVLCKLQKDYQGALRFYQQAEKLMPDDSALKIISALLLVEHFAQYDTALRKMEKLIQAEPQDPAIQHHARAIRGMAFLFSGKKDKAREILNELIAWDFESLRFPANADLRLVGACVKKNFAMQESEQYLMNLLRFAEKKKDKTFVAALNRLLGHLKKIAAQGQ